MRMQTKEVCRVIMNMWNNGSKLQWNCSLMRYNLSPGHPSRYVLLATTAPCTECEDWKLTLKDGGWMMRCDLCGTKQQKQCIKEFYFVPRTRYGH